jgi:hypothetical protein
MQLLYKRTWVILQSFWLFHKKEILNEFFATCTLEFFDHHKVHFCFMCQLHYTPFTCDKIFLKFWDFKKHFENFEFHNFSIVNVFQMWVIGYYHFNFLPSKFLIKRVLRHISCCKIDFFWHNYCSSLIIFNKLKSNLN